ncbi:MAG TPA: DNA mismatch repair endonuclease MutL [Candidatus Dormibacteraeota bacterium]|nr:DNA mismatch repair endonuclease MutL [Candidatus Dormibacteraeota bacterium]
MATPGRRVDLNGNPPGAPGPGGTRSSIRQLAPEVADLIAAGEVVERPASVVKELVENGLDAGAARITVEIEGGGMEMIRVVDDGRGMPSGELALALQRHATSKLTAIDDLTQITTFGFRGEALASMAAVAGVVLVSRERDSVAGARVEVAAQGPGPATAVAAPPGTSVEVRRLFHNTPARRAFLRSTRSEATACLRVVSEAALGRPDVRFEARAEGRRTLGTPGDGDLVETARSVLGRGVADQLIPVYWQGHGVAVVGVLGPPGVAHPNRNALVVMVNGRRVHQRTLAAAVEGAYRGLLEVGRHPLSVLDIRCDPREVDVNVHPTKREVRFRDEGRIFEAVQRACWGALRDLRPANLLLSPESRGGDAQVAVGWSALREAPPSNSDAGMELLADQPPPGDQDNSLAGADRWRYLGQAHNRYLVVETERGLGLVDQHAAHEKVLYTRVLEVLATEGDGGGQAGQGLLSPMLVEVGPAVVAGLADAADLFRRAGFDLESFGVGTVRCSAVPMGTRLSELRQLLVEVIGSATAGEGDLPSRRHRLAASVACHSAVRFGDPVTPQEVSALLRDLAGTPGGITCPHGRPAVLLLSEGQLMSAFRRH